MATLNSSSEVAQWTFQIPHNIQRYSRLFRASQCDGHVKTFSPMPNTWSAYWRLLTCARLWTLYEGELRMSQMVSKIMKLGAFFIYHHELGRNQLRDYGVFSSMPASLPPIYHRFRHTAFQYH